MYSKITVLVFLVVYFLSDFSHGQRNKKFFRKDYNYIDEVEGFYKIHTTPQTWFVAKQLCALEGASLFYPENENEVHAVISSWNETQPANSWSMLLGMSNLLDKIQFQTIDGRPVSEVYNNWAPGEPNNLGGEENCVNLFQNGYINDCPCDNYKEKFICKKSLESLEWNYNCSMPNLDGQRNKKFFRKDYNYIDEVEGFYKIHTTPQTWFVAKQLCALEGASLFYPENENEVHAVISSWNETQPANSWSMLLGMSKLLDKIQFQTIDGRPVSEVYNNWAPGEPNNLGGEENCVNLLQNGYINDYPCDNYKEKFICKKSLESLEWNYNCSMPDLDYIFNEDSGNCYKLHTTPLNWTEAYTVCGAEQSYLAVINNQLEADYLAGLTEFVPTPSIRGNYLRGLYHLGFHNRFSEGWQTVKGTPFNSDADAWWDHYQPVGNEQCGSMFFNGRLNNVDCDTRSFFICEHEVDSHNLSEEGRQ